MKSVSVISFGFICSILVSCGQNSSVSLATGINENTTSIIPAPLPSPIEGKLHGTEVKYNYGVALPVIIDQKVFGNPIEQSNNPAEQINMVVILSEKSIGCAIDITDDMFGAGNYLALFYRGTSLSAWSNKVKYQYRANGYINSSSNSSNAIIGSIKSVDADAISGQVNYMQHSRTPPFINIISSVIGNFTVKSCRNSLE